MVSRERERKRRDKEKAGRGSEQRKCGYTEEEHLVTREGMKLCFGSSVQSSTSLHDASRDFTIPYRQQPIAHCLQFT